MDTYLEIIGILLSIIGIIGSIYAWLINRRRKYVYSWKRVVKGVKKLKIRLTEEQFTPDVLLSYPQGGLIVADLLYFLYDFRIPICVLITHRVPSKKGREVVINTEFMDRRSLFGKKILIVDDVVQSGSTLKAIISLLVDDYGIDRENIKTACLAAPKGVRVFTPDFFVYDYADDKKQPSMPWGRVPRN